MIQIFIFTRIISCSQAGEDRPSRPAHLEWDWRYPIAPYVPPPNPQPLQRPSLRRSRNSVLPAIGAFGAQAAAPAADAAASTGERSNGKDAGCQVLVRLWRYQQSGKPALEMLMLAVQNAVLCSDMGLSISPCGKMLALCASSSEVRHEFLFFSYCKDQTRGNYITPLYASQLSKMRHHFHGTDGLRATTGCLFVAFSEAGD